MNNPNDRIVWIDLETTGLDPKKDLILEVAMIITNKDLGVLAAQDWVVYRHEQTLAQALSPVTRMMHKENGLLNHVPHADKDVNDVMMCMLRMMQDNGVRVGKGVLAGSSIHFDRKFMKEQMPLLETFFYHRMFDTSALKTAAQMWAPQLIPPNASAHRAMADIQASLSLARHFRMQLFANHLPRCENKEHHDGHGLIKEHCLQCTPR